MGENHFSGMCFPFKSISSPTTGTDYILIKITPERGDGSSISIFQDYFIHFGGIVTIKYIIYVKQN